MSTIKFIKLIQENNFYESKTLLEKKIKSIIENRVLVQESINARVDQIMQSVVFRSLGRDYIENKFEEYKSRGVVPKERVVLGSLSIDPKTTEMVKLSEREYEEVLPYVFKFIDIDVKKDSEVLLKDDVKGLSKLKKHYSGVTLRPVFEDASQIKSVLTNWLAFRNKKDLGVPKSLRDKYDFEDLLTKVDNAMEKLVSGRGGEDQSSKSNSDPDYNMPEGFKFLKESGNLRLYKWHSLGDVCELDTSVRKDWLSLTFDVAGNDTENWCVNSTEHAQNYGFEGGSGSGKFDYPYYMVREKSGGSYKPKYLLHGNSKQAKEEKDRSMTKEMAQEVMSGLISEDLIKKIYEGTS